MRGSGSGTLRHVQTIDQREPLSSMSGKSSTPAVVGWGTEAGVSAGVFMPIHLGAARRGYKKANRRHQGRRLAENLPTVDRLDRPLNDIAMASFWSTPADQVQILFLRQLS